MYATYFTASRYDSLFLTQPGEGEEVVYAPAGHNTTLTCAVSGVVLLWEVSGFRFGYSSAELHRRGIFQSQLTNSSKVLSSTLSVLGSDTNHEANICCLSRISETGSSLQMCCTVLFVYSKWMFILITEQEHSM